jgi:ribosomal protein S18 acetylase RimI-like enzyme
MEDIPFMDALQKKHGRALGYFPRQQFEGYVRMGAVLVAENVTEHSSLVTCGDARGVGGPASDKGQVTNDTRLGYCISRDRYLKRDELGVVYQLCVAPDVRRGLIGATLVRAAFERAAYGCRLFCCWCAQDLDANWFWESLGFVPLAFRAGGKRKKQGGRVHIYWQKRIVHGDERTPWWYPFQTNGGAIRADRLVWPIPPRVHWSEVKPPEILARAPRPSLPKEKKQRTGGTPVPRRGDQVPGPGKVGILVGGRIKYVQRPGCVAPAPAAAPALPGVPVGEQPKPTKRHAGSTDPVLLGKVRELRDRCLEHVNREPGALAPAGKYDVTRALPETRVDPIPIADPAPRLFAEGPSTPARAA